MNYVGKTNRGNVRKNNEDSYYISQSKNKYFIVADGMGGHLGGEEASSLATKTVAEVLDAKKISSPIEAQEEIALAIKKANTAIYKKGTEDFHLRGMGTTLSLLYFFEDEIIFSNVGDSRIYSLEDNTLTKLTKDDSFVNYLVEIGDITEEEANHHPKKNVLTKALGTSENIEFKVFRKKLSMKEKFLLCSDGLSNMVEEKIMAKFLRDYDPEKAGDLLIKEALKNGGLDNITLIVIDLNEVDDDR